MTKVPLSGHVMVTYSVAMATKKSLPAEKCLEVRCLYSKMTSDTTYRWRLHHNQYSECVMDTGCTKPHVHVYVCTWQGEIRRQHCSINNPWETSRCEKNTRLTIQLHLSTCQLIKTASHTHTHTHTHTLTRTHGWCVFPPEQEGGGVLSISFLSEEYQIPNPPRGKENMCWYYSNKPSTNRDTWSQTGCFSLLKLFSAILK